MKGKGFYKKLLTLFLLVGITPALIIGFSTSILVNRMVENKLVRESHKTISNSLTSIESLLSEYAESISTLANTELFTSALGSQYPDDTTEKLLYEKMYTATASLSPTSNIHLINAHYGYILSLHDTPAIYHLGRNSNWGCYRLAKSSPGVVIYPNRYKNTHNVEMVATAIQAFYTDGQLSGYIAIDIPLKALKEITGNASELLPIHFTLATNNNYVLWNDLNFPTTVNYMPNIDHIKAISSGHYIEKENNQRNLITYARSNQYDLILLGGLNIELITDNLSVITYILIVTILLTIFICVLVSIKLTQSINAPLQAIVTSMEQVEKGDFDVEMNLSQDDEFGYVAKQFNTMCRKIKELFRINQEKQELLRISEIKNLHAQINPHFLYNTLDSIKYLAKMSDEKRIYVMIKNLSFLLKNGFNIAKEFVTIEESLKSLESYIAIQQIRFPDKFKVQTNIDPNLLNHHIPNLLLQPILENAMVHGLEPLPEKGLLSITGYSKDKLIVLSIADNGVGMTRDQYQNLIQSLNDPISGSHIGLKNAHQRIQLYYGKDYGLSIKSSPQKGTSVTMELPTDLQLH